MIKGAHIILYSSNAEADRLFIRDVLGFTGVDAGEGWLIFKLPPAEIAVHPARGGGRQELYLMVDDIEAAVARMRRHRVRCDPVQELGWGRLTYLKLPGGGKLGLYEARHRRPKSPRAKP